MRRLAYFLGIFAFGFALFFVGGFIYRLGQRTASELSGADRPPSVTMHPVAQGTSTITQTLTPDPTSTSILVFAPTATATIIPWTSCPGIVVTVADTSTGDFVHVLRCSDGLEYDIGPLSKGVYAVSPDDKYLVYCSLDGVLYAARIGSSTLSVIKKMDRDFYTFGRDVPPIFVLKFNAEKPNLLEIHEKRYVQKVLIDLPGWLSNY
jgi:hypothetical protein